jgi:hypothetical protein
LWCLLAGVFVSTYDGLRRQRLMTSPQRPGFTDARQQRIDVAQKSVGMIMEYNTPDGLMSAWLSSSE